MPQADIKPQFTERDRLSNDWRDVTANLTAAYREKRSCYTSMGLVTLAHAELCRNTTTVGSLRCALCH